MKNPENIVQLIDIERKLWSNDDNYYQQTLTDEAVLVFQETGVISKSFAVEAIKGERATGKLWEEVTLDDVRHIWISDDVVILSYRVAARWKDDPQVIHCLASSVYKQEEAGWKLVFHQQTPISEDFKPLELFEN